MMPTKSVLIRTLDALDDEMIRARTKFPDNVHLTVALGEEYGELCQAQLQQKSTEDIRAEALQVACVALRIYEEGDRSLTPGLTLATAFNRQ